MLKNLVVLFVSLVALCAFPARSQATIVNFETLSGDATLTTEFGITWSQWEYSDELDSPYIAHSGDVQAYLSTDNPNRSQNLMAWTTPVLFNGAWFTGNLNTEVQIVANSATGVLTSSWKELSSTPQYLNPNFDKVSSVWVNARIKSPTSAGGFGYFAMDDVTYNEFDVNPVPEPASVVLLSTGFIGMFFRRKFLA